MGPKQEHYNDDGQFVESISKEVKKIINRTLATKVHGVVFYKSSLFMNQKEYYNITNKSSYIKYNP